MPKKCKRCMRCGKPAYYLVDYHYKHLEDGWGSGWTVYLCRGCKDQIAQRFEDDTKFIFEKGGD